MNNPKQRSPQEIVTERTMITERPSFGLGIVRREREIMKKYPPNDNLLHLCKYCMLRFPTFNALKVHQNTHKLDLLLERQLKKESSPCPQWPKPYNNYQYKFKSRFGGPSQDALSKGKYLGTSPDPSNLNGPGGNSSSNTYPSFNGGVSRGITDMNMTVEHQMTPDRSLTRNTSYGSSTKGPLPSYNYNMNNNHVGLSSGPFQSIRSGSTNSVYPWFNGGVRKTVVAGGIQHDPHLMQNICNNSASRATLPSYNYSSHALSNDGHDVELSLGRFESIGGGGNNNYIPHIVSNGDSIELRSLGGFESTGGGGNNNYIPNIVSNDDHVELSFGRFESIGGGGNNNYIPHIASNDDHVELSLGPSKSIGENKGVYPSLSSGVTRETTCMTLPLRPRVSRYHYVNGNPLDSIMRNVPPSPPPTTNLSNDLSSLKEYRT
ncbi:unnamed protein product [Arabis nemorensis]|uniref:C2H2-type domain-containing protein n=1 Tax=Arabis nemorensis TaxID=586526 RepID=A0A565CQC0_9BRAS|nr:unnamed protein product [Arabis nemorensis]